MILHDEATVRPLIENATNQEESITLPFRESVMIFNAQLQRVFAFNRAADPLPYKTLANLKNTPETRFVDGKLTPWLWYTKAGAGESICW